MCAQEHTTGLLCRSGARFPCSLVARRVGDVRELAGLGLGLAPALDALTSSAASSALLLPLVLRTITVYWALGGALALALDGRVRHCCHHLAALVFGYARSELIGQVLHITSTSSHST